MVKIKANELCPCGSAKKYKKCCRIFHEGTLAPNALLLMKSRYSAFVCGHAEYIMKTTHSKNPDFTENVSAWKNSIEAFYTTSEFKQLHIIAYEQMPTEAFVTFRTTIFQNKHDVSFTEKSRFFKEDCKWLYHSGEFIDE